MFLRITTMALATATLMTPAAYAADPEGAYNTHCRQCHGKVDADKGALGPSLKGIVGKKSSIGNVTWDEKTLTQWIKDPNSVISGNGMSAAGYSGIQEDDQVKAIIEHMKSGGGGSGGEGDGEKGGGEKSGDKS